MTSARRELGFFSAALAVIAAVLAVLLPLTSDGEGRGRCPPEPEVVSGACVAPEEPSPAVGCGQSFTPTTKVLTASGQLTAISDLSAGDRVTATNTKTGRTGAQTVSAVLVNHDTDLYDLKVQTTHGTAVIHTTRSHLFWDASSNRWVKAAAFRYGARLGTLGTGNVTVLGGDSPAYSTGWMWDLSVPGDQDFYVKAGQSSVLVHNCTSYSNLYGGSHGVIAEVDEQGVLNLAIERGADTPSGSEMFDEAMQAVGEHVRAIRGTWGSSMPDNLNSFNGAINSGMDPEQAAFETFTGKMAARYGFTQATVENLVGEPGAYRYTQILFSR
jgi:hypothetical protein